MYFLWWLTLVGGAVVGASASCERTREGITASKSKHTSRFRIEIHGSPINYVPGEKYTVVLKGSSQGVIPPAKFVGFSLTVEPLVEASSGGGTGAGPGAGTLTLLGAAASRYHNDGCPNMITHASSAPKSEVEAYWEAPQPSPGPTPHCVVFRATVIESGSLWYEDDGLLTKVFCEQQLQGEAADGGGGMAGAPASGAAAAGNLGEMQCCACDEAKYEVTFEGLWSRHTHPKDFPSNASLVPRFSDVIGASHTTSYRFWEYGGIASEGLKQLAETGSTRMLESELKSQSQNIRTIIIAKGISYPNVTGQTYAVFRVDSKHHRISLVSMIEPSPDWIVGVSGLELCLPNCSWTESRVVNLYPWDAGTDSGITYTSPDKPTDPRDHIRRITTSFPNDPQAPFFDPTGEEMKPLARLYLTRQRLYEKSCSDTNLEFNTNEACEVEEWGPWGPCSVSCGAGKKTRQRFFKNEQRASLNGCKRALTGRETCYAPFPCRPGQPSGPFDPMQLEPMDDEKCATSEWSEWSGCSVECGKGEKHRFRSLKYKKNWKECRTLDRFPKMQDNVECIGVEGPDCPDEASAAALLAKCDVSSWSDWSPCSVSCGNGTRTRERRLLLHHHHHQPDLELELERCKASTRLVEYTECQAELVTCKLTPQQAISVCQLPRVVGPCRGFFEKWFFDVMSLECHKFAYSGCRGNRNRFDNREECDDICQHLKDELLANRTARLQKLGVSLTGSILNSDNSKIESDSSNQDKVATQSLFGGLESDSFVRPYAPGEVYTVGGGPDGPVINCQVSTWTPWTDCSVTCGRGTRKRTRHIVVHAKNGGKDCPRKLMQRRSCRKSTCNRGADNNRADTAYDEEFYDDSTNKESSGDGSAKVRRSSRPRRGPDVVLSSH